MLTHDMYIHAYIQITHTYAYTRVSVSFAQTWCGIERDQAAETGLFDAHAPRKWRVIGTLSDSEGFSEAYKCKQGQC
jgi:predicted metalloendopeptidase